MERLIKKYESKLIKAKLVDKGAPILGGLDAELYWNRRDSENKMLEGILRHLNINSLLFSETSEPYRSIINCLAKSTAGDAIFPKDSETRNFLHDLPISRGWDLESLVNALKHRKCVIVPDRGIVTYGTVSPEQAFVVFSSVCFACFVKFFSDYLRLKKENKVTPEFEKVLGQVFTGLSPLKNDIPKLEAGPYLDEGVVYRAISEAGKKTVEYNLVDSYFGNISYRQGDVLYISQTSSSLDELDGFIDPVPLDGSSCAGITASSEFTAHREIVTTTENRAILHGHPKFAVIMSMYCEEKECESRNECHLKCQKEREIDGIPIVPGEVGTGRYGLCHTLPPAIRKSETGTIVYGHGVFTVGREDFNEAFQRMLDIEGLCYESFKGLL